MATLTAVTSPGEPVRLEAGDDRARGDEHGEQARIGHGDAEVGVHHGPAGARERVGEAEADEREVDDREKH
jgi:hypothetical protein